CPATLAAGQQCSGTVQFSPTGGGSKEASVAIVTPLGNVRTVELRGLGPDVQANIAPTTLNFGNVGLLVPSEPRSFELTNTGTIPLEVIALKDFMLPRGYSAESN